MYMYPLQGILVVQNNKTNAKQRKKITKKVGKNMKM